MGYGLLAILITPILRLGDRERVNRVRLRAPRREAAYALRILQLGRRSLVYPLLAVMRRA